MAEIVARWQDWSGEGVEHLVLSSGPKGIHAEAVVIGSSDGFNFGVQYQILCDTDWHVRHAEVRMMGRSEPLVLAGDGAGRWRDGSGSALSDIEGAIDIDLSVSAFTNTLPIRRLHLESGQSHEIVAAYVRIPEFTVESDEQRYTCLKDSRHYRYEAVDGSFTRDIDVDEHGLIMTYPGLFRRLS